MSWIDDACIRSEASVRCLVEKARILLQNHSMQKIELEEFARLGDISDEPIYLTNKSGFLMYFNQAAADFWGWHPPLGEQRWCGSWRLYRVFGRPLPHDQCPMAVALRRKRSLRGGQAIAERPDGSRAMFQPFPTPILDANGDLIGGLNLLLKIPEITAIAGRFTSLADRLDRLLCRCTPHLPEDELQQLIDETIAVMWEIADAPATDLVSCCRKASMLKQALASNLEADDPQAQLFVALADSLRRDLGVLSA